MGSRRIIGQEKGLRRMRRNTPKRASKDRKAKPGRQAFLAEFPWCWYCENAPSECVHEMASGTGNRPAAFGLRFTWGAACGDCNCHRLTDNGESGEWPHARQLAVKRINDKTHYDRVGFNRLRGRADNAISEAEVIVWVCRMLDATGRRF